MSKRDFHEPFGGLFFEVEVVYILEWFGTRILRKVNYHLNWECVEGYICDADFIKTFTCWQATNITEVRVLPDNGAIIKSKVNTADNFGETPEPFGSMDSDECSPPMKEN